MSIKKVIRLDGDLCPNCAGKIEHEISGMSGVDSVRINAFTGRFILEASESRFNQILADSVRVFNRIEPGCQVLV